MIDTINIRVVVTSTSPDFKMPRYATNGASGMDLQADIRFPHTLFPGQRALFRSGIVVAIPDGYEMQIRSRSGLALKHGIVVLNSPGTIDADYRGEVGVILHNAGDAPVTIEPGMRIAQAVIAPVVRAGWMQVDTLDDTARGVGGFGSTGVNA